MNKGVGDGRCSDASSLHMDLASLVTWAHSHGAICSQIPALETAQNTGHPRKGSSLLWMCGVGHAYYWHCGELDLRSREEYKGVRKRSGSDEPSSGKDNLDEKRFRMTPFFERSEEDAADTGSWSGYPGVTRKDDIVCVIHNEPPARENQLKSKSLKSRVAVEHRLSTSSGEANTSRCQVMPESNKDLKITSDEQCCVLDEGDREDRANQNILSEPPEGAAAVVDLQRRRSQRVVFNMPTATRTSASAPTGKPPLTPAFIPKSFASNQESLDSSFLRLSPPNLAGPKPETSIARNSSRSETPEEHLQSLHVSNTEVKAQPESPTSVTFFGFQAALDIQEQLQLSPPECGFSRNAAEHPTEEAEPSGSGPVTHLSSSVSSVSSNEDPLPASSSESMLKREKKRNRSHSNIKVFKDWLLLHHPSETREIHKLPPEDLNNYLASFYSSVKSQKGMDFSKASLHFFQLSIERYLKDHGYKYSVVKGLEFRMAQEALQLRQQQLSQRKQEDEWSIVEGLTEEDVDTLRRKELLSKENPQGLLTLMLINIIRGFGARTHSRSLTLYWGQLVLRQDEAEMECLEWKDEPGKEVSTEEPAPQLLAKPDNPENCPVMDYKEYAKRRPPDMCNHYDPLYLAPKPLCSTWDQVWFCRKPLAKAKLKKIFSIITQHIKGPGKTPKK